MIINLKLGMKRNKTVQPINHVNNKKRWININHDSLLGQ